MPTAGDLFQALVRKIGRKKLRRNFFRIFLWGLNPKTDYNPLHSISTPSQTLKKHSQPVLKKLVSLDSTIVSSLSGLVGLVSGKRFPSVYLATSKTRAWLLPLRTAFVNKGSRPCFRDHLTPTFFASEISTEKWFEKWFEIFQVKNFPPWKMVKNFRKKSKFYIEDHRYKFGFKSPFCDKRALWKWFKIFSALTKKKILSCDQKKFQMTFP